MLLLGSDVVEGHDMPDPELNIRREQENCDMHNLELELKFDCYQFLLDDPILLYVPILLDDRNWAHQPRTRAQMQQLYG